MKIRDKLTLQFALIVASIILLFSVAIYFFSSNYRMQQFTNRLSDRARTAVKLLVDVKEVDSNLLDIINKSTIALTREVIQVYNPDGVKIYSSIQHDTLRIAKNIMSNIRLEGEHYFKAGDEEGMGIVYPTIEGDYIAIAAAYDKYGLGKLANLRIIILVGLVICVGLTILAGWFYSGQAISPISHVVSQVEKITFSNLNSRVDEGNGKDEIAILAVTFNKMLGRLQSAFEMQRSFVSNASHELRTPLTSITGQIEVTLLSDRDITEYKDALRSILEDIRSLNKLINGLLDMALVEIDISEIKFKNLRIDELLWQSRMDLIKLHKEYIIDIKFENIPLEENSLIVKANEHLLKTAFINLMDNACKYSDNKTVEIILEIQGKILNIVFNDKGIGIAEEDIGKIFQPFYRATNSSNIRGHGLGIPLASKIITLHGGNMIINSKINEGTSVVISMPSLA